MGTISCHSNQSSYPIEIKNTTFRSPTYRLASQLQRRCRLKMLTDDRWTMDGRTTDGRWTTDRQTDGRTTDSFIYYMLTNEPSAQVS